MCVFSFGELLSSFPLAFGPDIDALVAFRLVLVRFRLCLRFGGGCGCWYSFQSLVETFV